MPALFSAEACDRSADVRPTKEGMHFTHGLVKVPAIGSPNEGETIGKGSTGAYTTACVPNIGKHAEVARTAMHRALDMTSRTLKRHGKLRRKTGNDPLPVSGRSCLDLAAVGK